jgi:hypothetical protein
LFLIVGWLIVIEERLNLGAKIIIFAELSQYLQTELSIVDYRYNLPHHSNIQTELLTDILRDIYVSKTVIV